MKVVVSLHHHFRRTPDGTVYPYHVFSYNFWRPYLEVFDEVAVFARLSDVSYISSYDYLEPASGPGVSFIGLPDFQGFKGFWKSKQFIKGLAIRTFSDSNAYLLRPPSVICDVIWKELCNRNYPYALEVVGDPWDAYSSGSVNTPLRPIIRRIATNRLKKQCRLSPVTSYVTEFGLQKRYPPGNWNTNFSDIILKNCDIIGEDQLNARLSRYSNFKTGDRIRLCIVGSLWHLAKAQDVLISAVAQCVKKDLNLELAIVGDGCFREQLQQQAVKLEIADRVFFVGHLPPGKKVFSELDKSDIYVLPSRQEGLPRSVIEAMARGLPCITSNVAGLPELVENKWLVVPEDVCQLADKIMNLCRDINELIRVSVLNHGIARKFQYEIILKKRIEMYKKLKQITQDCAEKK